MSQRDQHAPYRELLGDSESAADFRRSLVWGKKYLSPLARVASHPSRYARPGRDRYLTSVAQSQCVYALSPYREGLEGPRPAFSPELAVCRQGKPSQTARREPQLLPLRKDLRGKGAQAQEGREIASRVVERILPAFILPQQLNRCIKHPIMSRWKVAEGRSTLLVRFSFGLSNLSIPGSPRSIFLPLAWLPDIRLTAQTRSRAGQSRTFQSTSHPTSEVSRTALAGPTR